MNQPSVSQPDRLKQAYPELRGGRFLVLADFEDPAHMGLFELVNSSGKANLAREVGRGRTETGGAGMKFTAGSAEDEVVAASRSGSNAYLKRDWRPYDLLLISIHSPAADLAARVTITAGPPAERSSVSATVPLAQGWDTLRLDLAELAEQIPIDEIAELRVGLEGHTKPVAVTIDDILLTASREDLLGDPADAASGALYVQRVGRLWNIGAAGRFELTVMNGQIRRWYNLASDPGRVHNLLDGTSLGPRPVFSATAALSGLPATDDDLKTSVQQSIVEMTAVRVVLDISWRIESPPEQGHPKFIHWTYTIYPTGQVFVQVEALPNDAKSRPAPTTALVAMVADRAEVRQGGPEGNTCSFAEAANGAAKTTLAVIPSSCRSGAITATHDARMRQAFITLGGVTDVSGVTRWVAQFLLATGASPAGSAGSEPSLKDDLARRAADYVTSPPVQLSLGAPVPSTDQRDDGFDAGTGVFVVRPSENRVRMLIDGKQRPVYAPAFAIAESSQLDGWVYVDHLVLKNVARDAAGNVLFQLPYTITDGTLVEVLLRPKSSTSP